MPDERSLFMVPVLVLTVNVNVNVNCSGHD